MYAILLTLPALGYSLGACSLLDGFLHVEGTIEGELCTKEESENGKCETKDPE